MPSPHPRLTLDDVHRRAHDDVFGSNLDHRVGLELEWLVTDGRDGRLRPDLATTRRLVAEVPPLPGGGRITIEPGGQIELSTSPFETAAAACEAAANDLFVLDQACIGAGFNLTALGADPLREPERILTEPRYDAMQAHFDRRSPAGVTMMCNTASIQLNVGLGRSRERAATRWRQANVLGPPLIAVFANSPLNRGRPSGWVSSRLRSWWHIDPSRSEPVPIGADPVSAWAEYALDANVMLIRSSTSDYAAVDRPFSFREWIEHGHPAGWPTADDLDYHLTTLFPPVRPRGWLELRMLDALPTPFWHVAAAVITALLDDPDGGAAAEEAATKSAGLWTDAAQLGMGHPAIAEVASTVFSLALDVLDRSGDEATAAICRTYYDKWVARGRCPADDRLDAWRTTGELFPKPESPVRYAEYEELVL